MDADVIVEQRVPITEDTSSTETYQQIHTWLDTCKNEHPRCRAPSGTASIPTRLIYIDTLRDSSLNHPDKEYLQPKLVYTNDMRLSECKYIALSYRWPEDFPVEAKSSRDNVREQMRGLNISKLPQIFKDLFQAAVRLGINYVWIDALCIIQDDPEDWNREAALMIQIYRYAEFTVAAATPPTNPDLGLFRHGDPSDLLSVILPGVRDPRGDGSDQDVVVMKPQWEAYRESPLVSRGWCFQEREISRRILHYTETQVLWECRTVRASEGLPKGIREDRTSDEDWKKRLFDREVDESYVDEGWHRAVEDYSARDLTVFTDKLPALSGLAAVVRDYKPADCRYLAGLWEDNFMSDLIWSSQLRGDNLAITNTRYPEYVAPTWSWASVAGPVTYGDPRFDCPAKAGPNTPDPVLKVLDICVHTSTNDTFGVVSHAVLTCTAALIPGLLQKKSSYGPEYDVDSPNEGSTRHVIGNMRFDVDRQKYDENLEVVFCIYCGFFGDENRPCGPGLVVLPTGNRENEYRRIGMMEKMVWSRDFDSVEIKEITII